MAHVESLPRLLAQANRFCEESLRASLEAQGHGPITLSLAALLGQVDKGGTSTSELARRVSITRQAAQQQVRSLEAMGLVRQVPSSSDRRSKLVVATDKGRAAQAAVATTSAAIEAALSERVGPTRLTNLRRGLAAEWGEPVVTGAKRGRARR